MKFLKIYIVTYKRQAILNHTLSRLFETIDAWKGEPIEVNIINNHSEFSVDNKFVDRVNVLHNVLRPDWSNGNLAENWNQALIHGFKDLDAPDCKYVVTMQNDTVIDSFWLTNLMTMHERFNFIVGQYGDNLVSYTPEAVKKIGIWDENFAGIQYKEADYWIRALIFNKHESMINDTLHGLCLNNEDALTLDVTEERNFVTDVSLIDRLLHRQGTLKRRPDDAEHAAIWNTRSGFYKENLWNYFQYKWGGTWKKEPEKVGWVKNWSEDFVNEPPLLERSKVRLLMRYPYFETGIYDLNEKNYVVPGWREN